jgi:upstream activation factor subunit UAF30
LRDVGLVVWFDRWRIVPGTPWQGAIEGGLRLSKSCAVLMGKAGLSAWQSEEMRSAIQQRVGRDNKFRVIGVLLSGARQPKRRVPAFLSNTQSIRVGKNIDAGDGLHQLICGIQGVEPGSVAAVALPKGRVRYELRLQATLDRMDDGLATQILKLLQKVSKDPTLVIKAKRTGSVILVLEGDPTGLARIRQSFESGETVAIAGFLIESVRLTGYTPTVSPADIRTEAATSLKRRRRPRGGGFTVSVVPDAVLAEVVGGRAMPRTEVTKKLWAYSKKNRLQDKKDKRQINTDEKLRAVFGGKSSIDMLSITKLVSKRFKE